MACARLLAPAGQAASKPLVYGAVASPVGVYPALWDSASTGSVGSQTFQGLVAFKRSTLTLEPVIFKRERPWITGAHSRVYRPLRKDGVVL